MKKLLLFSVIVMHLICFSDAKAQVLNVNNNEQLYNQWCWAGCSKAILEYYGFDTAQCEIAEWVRQTATFNNFGNVNCCVDANQGCNYWNYNYGYAGSIQDILVHFGNLQNYGINYALTQNEITTEIQNNKLFVIRWGWSTGGGHFVVGHGISGNNVYYMNPWFGEGLHIATYNSVVNGVDGTSPAVHTWTHTNKITTDVSKLNEINSSNISIYPNPFCEASTIHVDKMLNDATITIYDSFAQPIKQIKNFKGESINLRDEHLMDGFYFINVNEGNKIWVKKVLVSCH